MKPSLSAAVTLGMFLGATFAGEAGPLDPRFFGEYCGAQDVEHCVAVKDAVFGVTLYTTCQTVELEDIRLRLNHIATPQGGLITGHGTATVDGDPAAYVMAGAVRKHGQMRGSATVAGLEPHWVFARLSADGLRLEAFAYGKKVEVRKDDCGNSFPEVELIHPAPNTNVVHGTMVLFSGRVEDEEDDAFPRERQSFVSSLDGELAGSVQVLPNGLDLETNTLSPGTHVITYSATDSGGLTASASITMTVRGLPPETPVILQPPPGATLIATGPVALEGKAYDPAEGMLPDGALAWSVRQVDAPDFSPLGTGRLRIDSFPDPGEFILRLTATNSLGASSFTEQRFIVQPFEGNTPPWVTIETPNPREVRGEVAADLVQGPVAFLGTLADAEDPVSDLSFQWRARSLSPVGVDKSFGVGDAAPVEPLGAVANQPTLYEVSFSAADTGGMTAGTSIRLLIMPPPTQ